MRRITGFIAMAMLTITVISGAIVTQYMTPLFVIVYLIFGVLGIKALATLKINEPRLLVSGVAIALSIVCVAIGGLPGGFGIGSAGASIPETVAGPARLIGFIGYCCFYGYAQFLARREESSIA